MERCETLSGTGWTYHCDDACPPGTDSFLLSAFPRLRRGERVCDLGAGAGLLGLLLLRREPSLDVTGVELRRDACALAARNAEENGLSGRFRVLWGDLRESASLPQAGGFDLAVSNPPYFPPGSGAAAPDAARRCARMEGACTPEELCRAAARVLRWGGRLALVHRPERLCDLFFALRGAGLEPKRLRWVQSAQGAAPSLVLLEARRGGAPGILTLPPLLLRGADGRPTAEADAVYFRTQEESL